MISELVADLHTRYTVASRRVGGWVYHDLSLISGQMRAAVAGPNPVGELRALAWATPSDGVGEVVDALASLVEEAGR